MSSIRIAAMRRSFIGVPFVATQGIETQFCHLCGKSASLGQHFFQTLSLGSQIPVLHGKQNVIITIWPIDAAIHYQFSTVVQQKTSTVTLNLTVVRMLT